MWDYYNIPGIFDRIEEIAAQDMDQRIKNRQNLLDTLVSMSQDKKTGSITRDPARSVLI